MKNKLNMTVLLAAVNVIVFLVLSIQGMTEDAEIGRAHV